MDHVLHARIAALETELAQLRQAVQADGDAQPAAGGAKGVSRRRLLWTTGAAAAGVAGATLGSPAPAAAQQPVPASQVTFTPGGGLSATNVQAALAELDSEKQVGAWIDIRQAGASTAAADNAAALQGAVDWVDNAGGGMVLIPSGRFRFGSRVSVPTGVSLWGCGGSGTPVSGSVLEVSDPNAQIEVKGRGGMVGNFIIDGRKAAVSGGPATGLLYLNEPTERHFTALNVHDAKGTAVVANNLQNALLTACNIHHCDGDGLVLDGGSASNSFVRCEINRTRGTGLAIRFTSGTEAPYNNLFTNCLIERGGTADGHNHAQLTVADGTNRFHHCWFQLGTDHTSGSGYLVNLTGGRTIFDGCTWDGRTPGITGLRVGPSAGAEFCGRNYFSAPTGIRWESGAFGAALGRLDFADSPGDVRWSGSGWQALAFQTDRPHLLLQESEAPYALRVARRTEAGTGYRFQVTNTGEIQMNNGNGFNPPKASLRLHPAGSGWEELSLGNGTTTPALPSDSARATMYVKGGKLVVAYRDGATLRYKYLDLVGSGATWTHSTTAP